MEGETMIAEIEIALEDWHQGMPLLVFLRERSIEARPALPPENGIVIDPAPTDPAAIEVYVALHSWLEQNAGSELNVKIDGRAYTMRGSDVEAGQPKPIDIRAGRRHAVRA
jgi:hypothetical protein